MKEFKRIVTFKPAFDKRSDDSSKNYGICSMEIQFAVMGPHGATAFSLFSGMHLPHIQNELWTKQSARSLVRPIGNDLSYHSLRPIKWHNPDKPSFEKCYLVGDKPCWYDGSSLNAEALLEQFLAKGDAVVWAVLESLYRQTFEETG